MIDREMLIDAIIGRGLPSMPFAIEMAHIGLAEFSGDQWNPAWEWNRRSLEHCDDDELTRLYELCTAQSA